MALIVNLPIIGDLALLDHHANPEFVQPIWFRCLGVRESGEMPGWAYVDGYEITRDGAGPERTVLVRAGGIKVRRGTEAYGSV